MSKINQVAIITGGASGIGYAVGKALSARSNWTIFVLDRDAAKGQAAADSLDAKFYEVDVADYASLAAAFERIFAAHGNLSFVFANAGIALDAKAQEATQDPPSTPSLDLIAVNLHSIIFTTTLAQHYFRKCTIGSGPRSVIVTASCSSFYASPISPMYCAAKHGVIGWTRSIAPSAWKQDHVSINAICPGIVRTSILPDDMYAMFPQEVLTPIGKVVEVALMLLDGTGSKPGEDVPPFGQTVEICGSAHYYRKQLEFCDATMAALMGLTTVEG